MTYSDSVTVGLDVMVADGSVYLNRQQASSRAWVSGRQSTVLPMLAPPSVLFIVIGVLALLRAGPAEAYKTAYEELEDYGFPSGLLPHIVTSYTLESNGNFEVNLEGKCRVTITGGYPLQYAKVISGEVSYGRLSNLEGITVKAFFLWWTVTGITVIDDDQLVFEVGIVTAKFPASNFDESPVCEGKSLQLSSLIDW